MRAEVESFFCEKKLALDCFEVFSKAMNSRFPHAEIKVQKTQISFYESGLCCCVSLPRSRKMGEGIVVTFGLDAPIPDCRIVQAVEVRPNRWTHHVAVYTPENVDEQLLSWIDWAHSFNLRKRRRRP